MRRLMAELDTPAPAGAAEPRNERARQLSEKVRLTATPLRQRSAGAEWSRAGRDGTRHSARF